MKKLFHYIVAGVGISIGTSIVSRFSKVMQNPEKRSGLKQKFTNIKNELFRKED